MAVEMAASPNVRPSPPTPLRDVLLRSRLVEALLDRWEHRVVIITAGAGFGKTTLLSQAVAENHLSPRGIDAWVQCRLGDDSADRMAQAILDGVGDPGDLDSDLLAGVCTALWRLAPDPVAIMVDDIHHLANDSCALDLLRTLVAQSPEHVHFVLSGRWQPALPLARLHALGEVVQIDEDALLFDAVELKEFASMRGTDPVPSATGGWPALAELSLSTGSASAADFLWEEVLGSLADTQRELLALLSKIGGADDALATDLLGRTVVLHDELSTVPMVAASSSGWFTVHALWEPALDDAVDLDASRFQVAAERARGDGHPGRAFEILASVEQWDDVLDLMVATCLSINPIVGPHQLQRWIQRLPPSLQESGGALLARGLATLDDDLDAALDLLERSRAAFEKSGDAETELAVLVHQANTVYFRGDLTSAAHLLDRVEELSASGHERAAAYAAFGYSLVAEIAGDIGQATDHLQRVADDTFDGSFGALVTRYRAQSQLLFGSLREAERLSLIAVQMADATFRPTAWTVLFWARWMSGDIDGAMELLDAIQPPDRGSTVRHDVGSASNTALVMAWLGDAEGARSVHQTFAADIFNSGVIVSQVLGSLALATAHLAAGDEQLARIVVDEELHTRPLEGRPTTPHLRAIALSYVLAPKTRSHWDSLSLGEGPSVGRAAGRLLLAIRGADDDPMSRTIDSWRTSLGELTVDPLDPRVLRAHLPTPWATEVAVALRRDAAFATTADQLLEAIGAPSRPPLRRLTKHRDKSLAKSARGAIAASADPPTCRLDLRLTGPTALFRDGVAVETPEWRRERVRALLAELVIRGRATREELAAALWPDLDPTAGANNLRVTLSYLLRVLEPDRADSEPSWFVKADRQTVSLDPGTMLRVDVTEIERHLEIARQHEEAGTLSLAADAYLAACDLYQGDLLADIDVDPSTELRRDRLRSVFVHAAIRGGELLIAKGDLDTALILAERALDVDEWSEDAYRVAASAHLARDDRGAALHALQTAIARCDELDVAVSDRTLMLARRLNIEV